MSRATAVQLTSVCAGIGAGNIVAPIQTVLRTDQNVVDHVKTSRDRVFPPAKTSILVCVAQGVIDLVEIVTTEVLTTAAERESVIELIFRIS